MRGSDQVTELLFIYINLKERILVPGCALAAGQISATSTLSPSDDEQNDLGPSIQNGTPAGSKAQPVEVLRGAQFRDWD